MRRSKWRDQCGATAVEMAMVVPLVLLIVGMLLFAGMHATFSGLAQNAAREAARFATIRTGSSYSATYPSREQVRQWVVDSVPTLMRGSNLDVTVQSEPAGVTPAPGDIVTVTLAYDIPALEAADALLEAFDVDPSSRVVRTATARRE